MRKFAADTAGATALEYSMLAALIAAVIVGTLAGIGTQINTLIASSATGLQ